MLSLNSQKVNSETSASGSVFWLPGECYKPFPGAKNKAKTGKISG